jgi:hypothetical protein
MKRTAFLLLACLLWGGCSSDKAVNPQLSDQDPEAYAVYSALIDSGWPWGGSPPGTMVIREESRSMEMCLVPDSAWVEIMSPAMEDYVRKNREPWLLQRNFGMARPYEILPYANVDLIFGQHSLFEGWELFYRLYPASGGIAELSAVGFNPGKTVAVLYAGCFCGPLCGAGGFHVFQKVAGSWIPLPWTGASCWWIS